MATIDQAITRIRERLDAGSYGFTLYYNGDDAYLLPQVPVPFAFVVFNNEGSIATAYGAGRGQNLYRNRMRVEAYVFSPMGYGAAAVAAHAEKVAAQLRSYRDEIISCFDAPVIPFGPGSSATVPGLSADISNYQLALVECVVTFDQIG